MQKVPFAPENFDRIARKLEEGEVFILPTDTCYGFSALPFSQKAINKIQEIKGRDNEKPFLLLVSSLEDALKYGVFSDTLLRFATERWKSDAPTTILARKKAILKEYFPNVSEVGLRVPGLKILQQFLQFWEKPLISTSANLSGNPSLYAEEGIRKAFQDAPIFFGTYGDLPLKSQSEIWKEVNKKLVRIR